MKASQILYTSDSHPWLHIKLTWEVLRKILMTVYPAPPTLCFLFNWISFFLFFFFQFKYFHGQPWLRTLPYPQLHKASTATYQQSKI